MKLPISRVSTTKYKANVLRVNPAAASFVEYGLLYGFNTAPPSEVILWSLVSLNTSSAYTGAALLKASTSSGVNSS